MELLARIYDMRLTEAFAIIRKIVDTVLRWDCPAVFLTELHPRQVGRKPQLTEKERLTYEAEEVYRFEFGH